MARSMIASLLREICAGLVRPSADLPTPLLPVLHVPVVTASVGRRATAHEGEHDAGGQQVTPE